MIELGLVRITRLLKGTSIPWRAMHVAGTNGKGSVCAYAAAMLHASNVPCGRFTSPHLMDRWDCISINEKTVDRQLFLDVEAKLKAKNECENIKASEFELLTATAFQLFTREKIEVGVVEVGLGGRHDATNVLTHPIITIITKIGEDHQSFLGDTIEEIAYQKAGIMKHNVPCLVDGSNPPNVIEVFRKNVEDVQAASLVLVPQDLSSESHDLLGQLWILLSDHQYEDHQYMHIRLAYEAVQLVATQMHHPLELSRISKAIEQTCFPGRLQTLSIEALTGGKNDVLLDGAHNAQSAEILAKVVDRKFRTSNSAVTWIIGVSHGKDVRQLLSKLLRPRDNLVAVPFSQVDGMPWVRPIDITAIIESARGFGFLDQVLGASGPRIDNALRLATQISDGGPIVIAGSLYLVSDVLRLQRTAPGNLPN